MRIESLTLHNLNALRGKFHIDFMALAGNGLFAIVGPTGAGKSTILDAICLALYGQTPRLGKITASNNALMTRHCGECSAEVVIAVGARRYRVFWGQKRARGKADGKLQNARHEIADADTGAILEDKTSRTAPLVEALTGLDFARFTRAVLLAQGQFSAFLHASGDERAPILEQITGTEIYSRLSIAAFERHTQENRALQALTGNLPTPPDMAAQQALAARISAQETVVQTHKAALDAARARHQALLDWQTQEALCQRLTHAQEANRQAQSDFAPQLAALQQHARTQPVLPLWQTLHNARAHVQKSAHYLATLRAQLPALAEKQQHSQEAETQAKAHWQASVAAEQQAQTQIAAVQRLDDAHQHGQEALTALNKRQGDTRARLPGDADIAALAALQADEAALQQQYQAALAGKTRQAWQAQRDAGEQRLSHLREARVQQTQLHEQRRALVALQEKHAESRQRNEHMQAQQALAEQAVQQAKARSADKRRLREYALLVKELSAHRQDLRDGAPCPLCGARQHPYAQHTPSVDSEEAACRAAEQAQLAAEQALLDANRASSQAQRDSEHAEQACAEMAARIAAGETALAAQLQHLEVADIDAALAQAEASAAALHAHLDELDGLQQAWQSAQQSTLARQWQEIEKEKQILSAQIADNRAARNGYFSTSIADYAQRWQQQTAAALAAFTRSQTQRETAQQAHHAQEASIRTAQTLLHEQENAQTAAAAALNDALHAQGFADEAAWQAAQLPEPTRAQWQAAHERLHAEATQLEQRLLEEQHKNAQLRAALPQTLPALEALHEAVNHEEAAYQHALQQQGELRGEHKSQQDAIARHAAQQQAIAAQQRECERWRQLQDLIGAADGKKFRNFAQGLTFEVMIAHANRELAKMSDRYLLVRAEQGHLELDVIDDYQGGEVRTSKNLSGGEQFIVSLALALGLSRMAGENIRIDSLFLDEGFGTLDEQALDQALDTLSSLPQQGKLIGIISHVGALRERIPAQIRVMPQSGGVSVLSGAGVE